MDSLEEKSESFLHIFFLLPPGYFTLYRGTGRRGHSFVLFHVICSSFEVLECGRSGKWTVSKIKRVLFMYISWLLPGYFTL